MKNKSLTDSLAPHMKEALSVLNRKDVSAVLDTLDPRQKKVILSAIKAIESM